MGQVRQQFKANKQERDEDKVTWRRGRSEAGQGFARGLRRTGSPSLGLQVRPGCLAPAAADQMPRQLNFRSFAVT